MTAPTPTVRATGTVAGPATATPVADLRHVSRAFGAVTALSDVSLQLHPGETHALLGPNGAGKTTLLRLVSGLVDPTRGEITVLGNPAGWHGRRLRRLIGYVPSGGRSFYLRVSGIENLVFFGRLYGLPRREAQRRAKVQLAHVGLADAARRPVSTYSQGMQRRLAIARALLHEPPLLLVDEATHDLDPEGARRVQALVRDAAEHGAAVLWTTQRLEEIRGFADRATLLVGGRVQFTGTVPQLLSYADTRRFVVRLAGDRGSDPAARAAAYSALVAGLGAVRPVPGAADEGYYLLALAGDAVLGDAIARLAAGGVAVVSCSEEVSQVETAFLRLTGDPT